MTGRFEWSDPRPGGSYRLVLTSDDPAVGGKAADGSDVGAVRSLDIVADGSTPADHAAAASLERAD